MDARATLKDNLFKLNNRQLKLFYGIIVHYWVEYKFFISKQNFYNLWCELNYCCYEVDENFPEPYDDYELLKSFCQEHPYYFIDILSPEMVTGLFCEYFDDRLDILAMIAQKLTTEGLGATFEYSNMVLGLNENVGNLVNEAEKCLKTYS